LRFERADLYVVKGRHKVCGDLCCFLTSASFGRVSMNRRRYCRERRNLELPISWNIASTQDVIAEGEFYNHVRLFH
jgi:hypothetical protein